ncbi:unnamed protein product [marine sediment metagenome]|uniref:Uncharacterized protein n=1 Tax=marine sediment metagenome TaxID=412755 RepID=X0TCY8_9ZZZZ
MENPSQQLRPRVTGPDDQCATSLRAKVCTCEGMSNKPFRNPGSGNSNQAKREIDS